MTDAVLRASLFALAKEIDTEHDRVRFEDWTKPPQGRSAETSLWENAVLNLFLTPRTTASAAAASGVPKEQLNLHVPALMEKGLLLTDVQWLELRSKHPYMSFRSLGADLPVGSKPFDNYEDAYAHGAAPWNELPVATDLLSLAPLPSRAYLRLLDVGCGTGHNLKLMEQLGFRCWGIDVSPTAIAQAKLKASHPDHFVAGSVTELPWPDGCFDLVLDIGCLHCLRHEEVPAYITEVRRVLVPDGRFLCRSFKPREEEVVKAQPVRMDRLGYTPDEVRELFSSALPVELVKDGPVHGFYLGPT
jgi:2-polyprenyl-3-methyl-5-hydroxy-6-metoxy-1,4-benzoquinol methylase